MKNLKSFWVIVGLAAVITGAGIWMSNQASLDQEALITKGVAVATPGASTNSQQYNQLLQQYKTTRIQIKQSCQVSPTNVAYKNGTNVMLDNRSSMAHVVTIGGASYNLPAYGFQVVTISSPTGTGVVRINCDKSVNVGTITVSK